MRKRDYAAEKSAVSYARVEAAAARYNFDTYTDRYDVPEPLAKGVCLQESEGHTARISGKNCIGLFQVAPGTARDMMPSLRGLSDAAVTQKLLTNPELNAQVGIKYLRWLGKELHKTNESLQANGRGLSYDILDAQGQFTDQGIAVVIAAYNHGPGNTKRKLRMYGDEWYARLPGETHNYVLDVMTRLNLNPPMEVQIPVAKISAKEASKAWEKAQYIDEIAERTDTRSVDELDAAFRQDPELGKALQRALNSHGYGAGTVDGKLKAKFEKAWAKMESAQQNTPNASEITVDGKVALSEIGLLLAPNVTRGVAKGPDGPGRK